MSRLVCVLMVGAVAPRLAAQTEDERAGARAAATSGAKAFSDGRYAEAIDLFKRAESLVHAPPHLLYLARSHEKLGHLVAAQEAYLKITREKLAADAPDAFKDAQSKAKEELAALEPRIPQLTITLKGEGVDTAVVTMDDAKVPPALVGVPHPVDPGQHQLVATGKGVKSQPVSVTVKEGGKESAELVLEADPNAVPPGAEGATTGGGEPTADTGTQKSNNGLRIGAYAALGVGVVGAAVGTLFAFRAKSKFDDANALCTLPGDGCPSNKKSDIQQLDDDGKSAKTLATVGFVVGGVGLATGVTLLILSGKQNKENTAYVQPWVGPGSAGVFGRF